MSEFTVDHDDVRISGDEAGEGVPAVLLHGLTASRRYVVMGSKNLERNGYRVVKYDARGHGRSSPAPRYEYGDLAADLSAVIADRGLERPVLAGASMGAHTAIRFALDHPDQVGGLVIITPAFDPSQPRSAEEDARWHALAAGLRARGVEGFVAAYGDPEVPEKLKDTVLTVLRQRLSQHEHPEAVADALDTVPFSEPFAALEDLERITAPTVVVASRDEADPGHPLAVGEAYAERIPGAELRTEDEGSSPLAWQGGQLSKVIAELAERRR